MGLSSRVIKELGIESCFSNNYSRFVGLGFVFILSHFSGSGQTVFVPNKINELFYIYHSRRIHRLRLLFCSAGVLIYQWLLHNLPEFGPFSVEICPGTK